MKVSGKILKQLTEAFLDAFDRDSLSQLIRESLDERFDEIVPSGKLRLQVHALLEWAQRQERLKEVVRAAAKEVSGNQTLQRAAVSLRESLNRPEPDYHDNNTRELSERLDEAYRRKADLSAEGEDTGQVVEDILSLRRRLRRGAQLRAGDYLLEGRFQLIQKIGRGGFAQVWKAYDSQSRALVAVKVLHGQHTGDRSHRERFFRGARKMMELHHQSILRVIVHKCHDDGWYFYVMEYVRRGDLRQAVLGGSISQEDALCMLLEVGDALEFAHQQGVIHRDVKPANILIDDQGRPKLTDFDLVLAFDTTGGTRTGGMLGTFLYMAPEVMRDAKESSKLADLYSLAMTAVFAIWGEELPPDVLKDAESFISKLNCTFQIREILVRAVAWEATNRFASVGDFCRELRQALEPLRKFSGIHVISRERVHPADGSVLVYVPGTQFTLGAESPVLSRPRHRVQLTSFWIGKYPVTNEQYRRFIEATGHREPAFWRNVDFNDPNQPVVGVSWEDSQTYCEWAGLVLPTEAQWEAASRGTDERRYPWGNDEPTVDHANFDSSIGIPTQIGSYILGTGPYGTMDQAGNVWEWCMDSWDPEAYEGREGQFDPVCKTSDGTQRVLRGGSWTCPASDLPATFRYSWRSGSLRRYFGFRVLRPAGSDFDYIND